MKSCSALIITLLLFCLHSGQVLGQCQQKVSAQAVKVNKADKSGSFDLKVMSNGAFKGQLVQIQGTGETRIESFSGAGKKDFSFSQLGLSQEEIYRVVVEFDGEEVFLCKRKVLDIDFTNR